MSYFRNTIPKLFDVILAPVVSLHDGSLKRLHSVGDCRKLRDSTAYLLYLKNKQKDTVKMKQKKRSQRAAGR